MKKSLFLVSMLSFFVCKSLTAQTFELGFGMHHIRQKGTVLSSPYDGNPVRFKSDVDRSYHPIGVQLVYNKPVIRFSDNMTICVQPGATFYAGLNIKADDAVAGWQLPLYAAFRVGNGASRDADKFEGVGIGVGPYVSGFYTHEEKAMMGTFALMLEVKFGKSGLRFEYPLKKYRSYYNSFLGPISRVESRFAQLYYTLNLNYE